MIEFDIIYTRPLSGDGKNIIVIKINENQSVQYYFKWEDLHFKVSKDQLIEFVKDFFPVNSGKLLGAIQDNPQPGGFGEYLNKLQLNFTPRYASAIASLMVYEGFLSFNKNGNAITLKRSTGKRAQIYFANIQ